MPSPHLLAASAACKIQEFSPTLRPATTKKKARALATIAIHLSIDMPCNKISDDENHVKISPKPAQALKGRPPDPWPLPSDVSVS